MAFDLEKMSISDLQKLQKEIAETIEHKKKQDRIDALNEAREAAAKHGYRLEELVGSPKARREKAKPDIKFRHPDDPEKVWVGLGRRPVWLEEELAKGRDLEEFRI